MSMKEVYKSWMMMWNGTYLQVAIYYGAGIDQVKLNFKISEEFYKKSIFIELIIAPDI